MPFGVPDDPLVNSTYSGSVSIICSRIRLRCSRSISRSTASSYNMMSSAKAAPARVCARGSHSLSVMIAAGCRVSRMERIRASGDRFSAADLGEGACDPLGVLHQFRKGNIPLFIGKADLIRMVFCSLFEIF